LSKETAVTIDAAHAPGNTGAPQPSSSKSPPPRGGVRSFVSRHPVLTALYAVLSFIGLLILAIIIFLWLANWNMLRGPIGRYASAQTHRHIELDGDLKVHLLTWTPTVTIGGVKIGNPQWAGPGDTADVENIIVSVKLLPLLGFHVVMPLLQFDKPVVNLYRDASGRQNWDVDTGKPKPNAKPFKLPPIEQFVVNDGHLKYVDIKRKMSLTGVIDSNERAQGPQAHAFSLQGEGSLNRKPFHLKVAGGPLIHVRLDQPYPFTGDVTAGDTHITAVGHLAKPFNMNEVVSDVHMSGRDLADLYYLTGLALPNTPAYDIKGVLSHKGREYDFDKAVGRVGDSDIEGKLKVTLSPTNRPNVIADLSSRLLDFKDLATLFGAPPVSKAQVAALAKAKPLKIAVAPTPVNAPATPGQRLLPDSTLATERLRGMDATLHYHALAIKSLFLPLKQATLDLNLDHGVLAVDPVAFDFPQGRFTAQVTLDARGAVPITDTDMRLSNVSLQEFLHTPAGQAPAVEGIMAARVKLHGVGDSVHKAAAASSGDVTVVIPQGRIRAAFAELLGVNAGKGLQLLLSKNQGETGVRCAVANFAVRNGVLQAQNVVFDTDVVKVTGTGDIDLGPESIDLTLKGDTKKFRIGHLFLPITLGGHLSSPKIGVQPAPVIAQGGVAAALGFLFPPAAILPFVDPGLAKNADCAALMTEAKTAPAAVKPSQAKGLVTTPAPAAKK
jgi:uncharacterized protein involved in outer membrane biogenesis